MAGKGCGRKGVRGEGTCGREEERGVGVAGEGCVKGKGHMAMKGVWQKRGCGRPKEGAKMGVWLGRGVAGLSS